MQAWLNSDCACGATGCMLGATASAEHRMHPLRIVHVTWPMVGKHSRASTPRHLSRQLPGHVLQLPAARRHQRGHLRLRLLRRLRLPRRCCALGPRSRARLGGLDAVPPTRCRRRRACACSCCRRPRRRDRLQRLWSQPDVCSLVLTGGETARSDVNIDYSSTKAVSFQHSTYAHSPCKDCASCAPGPHAHHRHAAARPPQ